MEYYHGTVSTFLPDIKRDGLKPVPDNSFRDARRISLFGGVIDANPLKMHLDGVYLTTSEDTAKRFSQYKAVWLNAPPGLVVMGEKSSDSSFSMFKLYATPKLKPEARPVVLSLNLPEDIVKAIQPDDKGQDDMFWYAGTIPASAIKTVIHPPAQALYVGQDLGEPDLINRVNHALLESIGLDHFPVRKVGR